MNTQEQQDIINDYLNNNLSIKQLRSKYHHRDEVITKVLDDNNIDHSRNAKDKRRMSSQSSEIIDDYVNNRLNLIALMSKYHTTYNTIIKVLDENNISHSRQDSPHHNQKTGEEHFNFKTLSEEEEKEICDIYQKTGRVSECEKITHHGQDVIRRCLQKYNLYRTQLEAVTETNKTNRKYFVNDDYFDTQNHEMAYILGFLAADGNVSLRENQIKINLSRVDKEFLNIFYERIGGKPIFDYTTNDGYDCSSWECHSKKIKDTLAEYGIIPAKTFILKPPTKLDKQYQLDYIRGFFDGDGCVSSAGEHAIRWQILSASKEMIEFIRDFFYDNYNIDKPSIQLKKVKNICYYIQYSSVPTRKIYDILYPDGCLYLPRKKEKFEQLYSRNLKK